MTNCITTRHLLYSLFFALILLASSCASVSSEKDSRDEASFQQLIMTFAGDIMAHSVNFTMKDYNRIYSDVGTFLHSDDLTFGNLETPITDILPCSTYPRFNVHHSYLHAAIDGGFDVFSLANNHSNDQDNAGIYGTLNAINSLPTYIYANGLRNKVEDSITPVVIKKKGWTIVFLAITEILNSHDPSAQLVYYSPPTTSGRNALIQRIEEITAEYPNAFFVLALHTNEPEYVRTVSNSKREWCIRLAHSGVDVVWAHHPHVMQSWEVCEVAGKNRLFMYSMGNFISGQRYTANIENPEADREYTGDAVLLRVQVEKGTNTGTLDTFVVTPIPITNYRDPDHGMVVKLHTDTFIESLPKKLRNYYYKRLELMEEYLPILP